MMANRWMLVGLVGLSLLTACKPEFKVESESSETAPIAAADETVATESSAPDPTADPVAPATIDETQSAEALADMTIVPGDRVGPVTSSTSRADLAAMFGESALEDTQVPVGEGFTESGTRVTPEQDKSFAVIWVDESQSAPATVKDFGPAWQTPEGIGVGTNLSELQQILGPFELYGFGWDYGGTLVLEGSNLSNYYGSLILRLQPTVAIAQQPAGAFESVQGDQLISSEDPNLVELDLVVDEMIVYLSPPVE